MNFGEYFCENLAVFYKIFGIFPSVGNFEILEKNIEIHFL
jgi:hypothetical protein